MCLLNALQTTCFLCFTQAFATVFFRCMRVCVMRGFVYIMAAVCFHFRAQVFIAAALCVRVFVYVLLFLSLNVLYCIHCLCISFEVIKLH